MRTWLVLLMTALLAACSTPQPRNINDVCDIYDEYYDWYNASKEVKERYGIPEPVTMAFIHQESKFIDDSRPPRKWYLWIIPGPRPSSAYGYAQALDSTWEEYQRLTGNWSADRDDFEDAVDFVGWYNRRTIQRTGIKPHDAYRLYLAYHEGAGGYLRGSYKNKGWLIQVAKKVQRRANAYQRQLNACREDLDDGWFWRSLFGQSAEAPIAAIAVPVGPGM
ncbi:hypothetical protein CHH28_13565 [Bacterioplanes sanyensis]|uniref:Transglycosylase SLT domain-containing protein n=1 Tax=Bacterioplanes sanyensis TaxID=1249553 RepID=A0A222FKS1_9GAMM|nr:transglycosylase SLT domain-containing protein [Bacterioplanes sanyensis]ASP39637.1 hypothetical protein CHH28_13565 [Bacterioplanes sanyensis]